MIKDYYNYLNEMNTIDNRPPRPFKIGDLVSCHGRMDSITFNGEIGVVIRDNGGSGNGCFCTVKFPKRFNNFLHTSALLDKTSSSYDIYNHLLKKVDGKDLEDFEKKKEEIRLKYLDIDPFCEEEWDE